MIKCTRTERKFKVDFLENKAPNEKFLFYIFDFFFHIESPPFRLYHQLPTTLYIKKKKKKGKEKMLWTTHNDAKLNFCNIFVDKFHDIIREVDIQHSHNKEFVYYENVKYCV